MATPEITIRPFNAADVDFIISRQLAIYQRENGLTSDIWIKYLTEAVQSFVEQFDAKRDCMFILENDGTPAGCVAITHVDEKTAQLRFYFVEPEIRGLGAGHKLLDMAVDFCREAKYEHVFLWTISSLMPARHLYESKGFQITETHGHSDWGVTVREERWDLPL